MFAALFVALVVPIGAFIAFYNCYYKRKNLPPGPMPLPFFGNSLALMKRQPGEDLFLEWRHKFGNIFTFWLGETPIVCIAEYGKMVEHYQRGGEPFSGRHAIESYEKIIRGGILGVLQTEGDIWRELRRFTLHVFRDFGVGKNLQQERILTEIEAMFKQLDTDIEVATEIEIVQYFERSISSIINALLVGFRFDETKEAQYHQLNGQLWRFNNRMQNFATNLFMWKPDWFKSMPYCRDAFALVKEVLRVGNVVAQDFPHRMMRDTRVDKWTLRRGQPIVAQISVVLMDPEIFPNPKAFQPERFLDEHGNVRKTDELIPFALGKRQCLGESLARMEMFLFFANILNRYKISAGHQMPSLERRMGIPVLCPKFTCRVEKRCTA